MRALRTGSRCLAPGALAIAFTLAGCGGPGRPAPVSSFVIADATVVDGTGAPAQTRSVRVDGPRIVAVGQVTPKPGERVVDGKGLVLAPGFIDTDSRVAGSLLKMRGTPGLVSQGVTTIVAGMNGATPYPLVDWLRAVQDSGVAVNVASFVGLGTIRRQIMRDDVGRAATAGEIDAMRNMLAREMASSGALGVSVDLEHSPGRYATTDEVIALGRAAAAAGGRFAIHLRSQDRHLFDALEEAFRVGNETGMPVHIADLRLSMRSLWGRAQEVVLQLDSARAAGVKVSVDAFPYSYWLGPLTTLFPEGDYQDVQAATFALQQLAPPDRLQIQHYPPYPGYEGHTLTEVAAMRGQDPVSTLMQLIDDARAMHASESAVVAGMDIRDVTKIIQWRGSNIATDATLDDEHPRAYGAFTHVLGPWVRGKRFTLEQAVHKMTGLPAGELGITDRGVVRAGAYADLVLFDPATVQDRATVAHPHVFSAGIEHVWVNGAEVYDGELGVRKARPGQIISQASGGALGG